MDLSDKMRRFAEFVVQGEAAVDAYSQSYAAANMNQATRRKRAAELLKHPSVKAHIAELRAKAAERAEITVAEVLQTLNRNLAIAMGDTLIKVREKVRDRDTGDVTVV